MSASFIEKLEKRVKEVNSLVCIGLDPHISQLPQPATIVEVESFCMSIINETSEYAAAFKPNSAFFEAFGFEGFEVLKRVIKAIPESIPIILDNKRGDIDTTAQAYATSSYEYLNADSVTLNPYMGYDAIKPFVSGKYSTKGAFILCKTSNPSSKDLQKSIIGETELYERVANLCSQWNDSLEHPGNIGVVVGATDSVALSSVRKILPNTWILCPGVGAQGGDAKSVCSTALRSDGSGVLINVSRSISSANDKKKAAKDLRDEINQYRISSHEINKKQKVDHESDETVTKLDDFQKEFIEFSMKKNVLQFGTFKLKSGRLSPYFFNAGLFSCGESLHKLGQFYAKAVRKSGIQFDVIFGPAYKGIPLAAAVSMSWYQLYGEAKDFTYNRKEVKDHGEGGQLVGASMTNKRVLVVDDVITAGTAIRESVIILQSVNAVLVGITVCLDRQEKTSDTNSTSAIQQVIEDCKVPVMSVIQLKHLISHIESQSQTSTSTSTNGSDPDLLTRIQEYRKQYGVYY